MRKSAMKAVLILSFISMCPSVAIAEENNVQHLRSRYGDIKAFETTDVPGGYGGVVSLSGKRVFITEEPHVNIYSVFQMNDHDVLLMGVNCGGQSCPADHLSLITIGPDKKTKTYSANDFFQGDGDVEGKVDHGKLVINLGIDDHRNKTAVFDGSTLKINYVALPAPNTAKQDEERRALAKAYAKAEKNPFVIPYANLVYMLSNSGNWVCRRYAVIAASYKRKAADMVVRGYVKRMLPQQLERLQERELSHIVDMANQHVTCIE